MDKANSADAERLQSLAKQHLMLHFSDMSGLAERDIPIIDRGEGSHVFDVDGRRYIDGLSGLYCVNLGHSHGERIGDAAAAQMRRLPFTSNWTVAHPPGIELATRLSELAPARPRPRLLRLRRSRRRRVGLEAGGPVPRGQRRTGAAPGDRPQGRLPRGLAGGAGDDRDRGMPDPVRAAGGAGLPRLQHQRLPPPGGRRRRAPLRRAADRDRGDDRRRGRGDDRDADRRAGAERGRLDRPARGLLGRACARSATGTGSCSAPTR